VLFLLCLLTQVPVTDSLDLLVERVHDSMISIDTHNDRDHGIMHPLNQKIQ